MLNQYNWTTVVFLFVIIQYVYFSNRNFDFRVYRATSKEIGKITLCLSDKRSTLSIFTYVFHNAYTKSTYLDPFDVHSVTSALSACAEQSRRQRH